MPSILSTLGATALMLLSANFAQASANSASFILQVQSPFAAINGGYILAKPRSPTFGSLITMDQTKATPFTINGDTNALVASLEDETAEQTAGTLKGRVYFATSEQLSDIGPGFAVLSCVLGSTDLTTSPALACAVEDRSAFFGCVTKYHHGQPLGWHMTSQEGTRTHPKGFCGEMTLIALPAPSSES